MIREVYSFSAAGEDIKGKAMVNGMKDICKDMKISFSEEVLKALKAHEPILKARAGGIK